MEHEIESTDSDIDGVQDICGGEPYLSPRGKAPDLSVYSSPGKKIVKTSRQHQFPALAT